MYSEQYYADVREAQELQEKKDKEEAEKKAREEAAKRVAEEKKAKEEAAKKAKEEAAKKVAEEKKAKEEAAKKAKEEAAKKVAEEKKAKEEAAKKAAEDKKAKEEAAERKAAASPYCSLDYQEYYMKKNGIKMLFPNERKAMKKYLSSFDEKHSVNVELEEKLFKGSYYKITRYDSEYIYYGEISENKPNGLGIIKRKINKSIIENSIENMEQSDSSEDVFFTVYAGYFKEGMPSGYGLQFASPLVC